MVYLLIAVALMFVIAPVLWLAPSARERHSIKLRQVAMQAGLRIKPGIGQQDPELKHWLAQYPGLQDIPWVRYSFQHPIQEVTEESREGDDDAQDQASTEFHYHWYLLPDNDQGWRWQPGRGAPGQIPAGLQAKMMQWQQQRGGQILGFGLSSHWAAVDWDERGSENDVAQLCAVLKQEFSPISCQTPPL